VSELPEVRLATDIARQFRHLGLEAGSAAVADHITRFWDPRMRAALLDRAHDGAADLDPLVAAAADRLR
jgi:formate dehydrogenase subunit delta